MTETSTSNQRDMETPLHKLEGLVQIISTYATGDHSSSEASVVFHSLGLVGRLLNEVHLASDDHPDLPQEWAEDIEIAIAVNQAIRGQFLRPEASCSGKYESVCNHLDVCNTILALVDHIKHLYSLALYPHDLGQAKAVASKPAHQRH